MSPRNTHSIKFLPLLIAVFLANASATPTVFPTGTTIYDPTKAYSSYVLFSAPDGKTHLIDMDGNSVKEWPHPGFPSDLLNPAVTGGKKRPCSGSTGEWRWRLGRHFQQ
jgi:hypothetical protein